MMKKTLTLALSIALCLALAGGVAVYAVWQNHVLNAGNTLVVGEDTETVTVTADISGDTVFYAGDEKSFTYEVAMDGVADDSYTVSAALSADCTGIFSITATSVSGNDAGVLTVADGDTVTVTVKMADLDERPDTAGKTFSLTVTLTANA